MYTGYVTSIHEQDMEKGDENDDNNENNNDGKSNSYLNDQDNEGRYTYLSF